MAEANTGEITAKEDFSHYAGEDRADMSGLKPDNKTTDQRLKDLGIGTSEKPDFKGAVRKIFDSESKAPAATVETPVSK